MNDPQCIASTLEKIKVMQAFCDGKQIVFKTRQDNCSDIVEFPTWNWSAYDYTIAPTPKIRAWKVEEVPLGAWMRRIDKHDPTWVCTHTETETARSEWFKNYAHSLDQGKTWRMCGKEEV